MKKLNSLKTILAVFIVAVFTVLSSARDTAPRGSGQTRGMISLEGYDINNQEYINLEDYEDKVVLVNFWATWCGYCTLEIPDLIDLQDDYANELVIIGLAYDYSEDVVLEYADEIGINYPLIMGTYEIEDDFGGISGYPTTFIIDKDGMIQNTMVGYRNYSQFESAILPYID